MLLVVLKMISKTFIDYLNQANQEDLVEINIYNNPVISLRKSLMDYDIDADGKTIIIYDKSRKEQFLININSIKSMRIVKPKSFGVNPLNMVGAKVDG